MVKVTQINRLSYNERESFARILHNPAIPVWVRVDNKASARYGTIAQFIPHGYDSDRTTWPTSIQYNVYSHSVHYGKLLHDDGRITKDASVSTMGLVWLDGYAGPSVWCFKRGPARVKPDPIGAKDRLGNDLLLNDLVVFTAQGSRYSAGSLYFGTVRKISDKGIPTVEAFKTREQDSTSQYRLTRADRYCKLTAEILDDLMIRRLMY